jgi:hypothetical protein|tara:strand:+ start:357 stop:1088 length:732 start_codon:yes stop_codon:yes gene_type:complete
MSTNKYFHEVWPEQEALLKQGLEQSRRNKKERMKQIPWPNIEITSPDRIVVPLVEDYKFESMSYLDTPEAKPIFEKQADIIIEKQSKGIIDVGCRHGPINKILGEKGYTDYKYMGFDTSVEPIQMAQADYGFFDNIEYRNTSWNKVEDISVDFEVDTVIFSGVLLYEKENHMKLFDALVNFYDAKHAIIQEPYHDQRYWDDRLVLQTITRDMPLYKKKYKEYKEYLLDCEIFSGKRLIVDITI